MEDGAGSRDGSEARHANRQVPDRRVQSCRSSCELTSGWPTQVGHLLARPSDRTRRRTWSGDERPEQPKGSTVVAGICTSLAGCGGMRRRVFTGRTLPSAAELSFSGGRTARAREANAASEPGAVMSRPPSSRTPAEPSIWTLGWAGPRRS